ncbi:MAG: IclR family transcriptional regulator [Alphaproteobacteria bacterium]|nr:IclR family transcriptional regulator [Alphaproteobacteria bacterium]
MRVITTNLDRAIDVIEFLAEEAEGLRLSTIAERLSLPKSAVHRLLVPLCARGWAEQDAESGRYRLSLRLAVMGHRLLYATRLPDVCQPVLDRLARSSRELVRLTLVQDESLVWIASAQGAPPGLMYQPSMTGAVQLHATANGKAWLASLPERESARIVRRDGLARMAPRTLATFEDVVAELERTRARGWGLAEEEAEPGVAALAVAIAAIAPGDPTVGTVSIAGPVVRVTPQRYPELVEMLRAAAAELQRLWPLAAAPRRARAAGG